MQSDQPVRAIGHALAAPLDPMVNPHAMKELIEGATGRGLIVVFILYRLDRQAIGVTNGAPSLWSHLNFIIWKDGAAVEFILEASIKRE